MALIAPFSLMSRIPRTGYHLVLAHLLDDPTYLDFFRQAEGYKILDNGAAEGSLVRPRDLIAKASWVNADEVVVPDVLGNCDGTIQRARDFRVVAKEHSEFKYMGVIQGTNISECMKCLTAMTLLEYITVLALPRHLTSIHRMMRANMVEVILDMEYGARFEAVHCLGSGSWTREAVVLADLPLVRGIDSAMPVVMGMHGTNIRRSPDPYVASKHKGEFFGHLVGSESELGLIYDNCLTFLDWSAAPISEV